jgi:extradiol dioxygenase family protein
MAAIAVHVFDRMSRISVGVFFAREPFFLVIEDQSWPALARQLDERNTGIMKANRRYTGQIGRLAALYF